ncbi:MAG: mercury(II) reductase [Candidatus Kryptoniota bacterium]
MKEYQLAIIGGGAASFAAATKAADLKIDKVVMINSGLPIGGTCVNVGCVPSKVLLEISAQLYYRENSRFNSLRSALQTQFQRPDVSKIFMEKDEIVESLRQSNYLDVISAFKNVEFIEGTARFTSENAVEVLGERPRKIEAEKFIIATGSKAKIPPIKGIEQVKYLTNIEALSLKRVPNKFVVLGGGPLGLEFAQMYRHFGSEVLVIEMENRVLPLEEPEVSREIQHALESEGIQFMTSSKLLELSGNGTEKRARIDYSGDVVEIDFDEILIATGVQPNTAGLNLGSAGVKTDRRGFIETDEHLRTANPNIYAAGDCVGKMALETVAAREGAVAAENALTGSEKTINYEQIPHAVFTMPQVASVGITEAELMKRIKVCACRTVQLSSVPKGRALKEEYGIVKLVINPHTAEIVGAGIVSPVAAEMIHEAALAIRNKMTIYDLIDTVHVFPTFSEGLKIAAQAFTRDISKMSCCIG